MERIRIARKKRGWTQDQLASAVGVKRSVISKYENGAISPSTDMLRQIAEALDVEAWELLDSDLVKIGIDLGKSSAKAASNILTRMEVVTEFQAQGYTFDPKEVRLVRAFSKINDVGQFQILQLAEGMSEMPRFMLEPPELAPQSPPAPQDGTDTTPPADAPETPPEGE